MCGNGTGVGRPNIPDPGGGTGLAAGGDRLQCHRVQPVRGALHGRGQTGRSGTHDDEVAHVLGCVRDRKTRRCGRVPHQSDCAAPSRRARSRRECPRGRRPGCAATAPPVCPAAGPHSRTFDPDGRRPGIAAQSRTGWWTRSVPGPDESLAGAAGDRRAVRGCGPRGEFRSRARTTVGCRLGLRTHVGLRTISCTYQLEVCSCEP